MIKIILGVYGDEINAQNINGVEIAKRLNNIEFEPHMFYYQNKPEVSGVIFHKTSSNKIIRNIVKLLIYIKGKYDIYYIPRVEKIDVIFSKLFRKKRCIVSSLEIENALHDPKLKNFFCETIFNFFTINKELKNGVEKFWNKDIDILYLGYCRKKSGNFIKSKLKRIAFVGSLTQRKRPDYIIDIAEKFHNIEFIIIGDGELKNDLLIKVKEKKLDNVLFLGKLSNDDVYSRLSECDLLLITSENEGQPKVSLEAASLGVPTCYIKNSYKIEYINNEETGFEVLNLEEMEKLINKIIKNPNFLKAVSINLIDSIKVFDWDILIKDYEYYFKKILEQWNNGR